MLPIQFIPPLSVSPSQLRSVPTSTERNFYVAHSIGTSVSRPCPLNKPINCVCCVGFVDCADDSAIRSSWHIGVSHHLDPSEDAIIQALVSEGKDSLGVFHLFPTQFSSFIVPPRLRVVPIVCVGDCTSGVQARYGQFSSVNIYAWVTGHFRTDHMPLEC